MSTQNGINNIQENSANKDASGGYAGLTLLKINFKNVIGTFVSFFTNANTAARTYTFQDRNGTIADDTDLGLKANIASPTFTGTPAAPTATGGTNTTQIATTAFVTSAVAGKQSSTLTDSHILVGNGSNVATDVALSGDVTIANTGAATIKTDVALAGNPTTTTQSAGNSTTRIATTAFVQTAVSGVSGSALSRSITQTAHGFAVGDWLYLNSTTYTKAIASSAAAAEVIGVVSVVTDANTFTLTLPGSYVTGLSGLTSGTVYFLSPSSAGAITATEPSTVGQVSKPLLTASSSSTGYVVNMRGYLLTATSSLFSISTKTADYTITVADDIIRGDATGGNITINLPTAVGIAGRAYVVKKIDSTGNTVTIDPSGAETIDGSATKVISSQYNSYKIVSNNVSWDII